MENKLLNIIVSKPESVGLLVFLFNISDDLLFLIDVDRKYKTTTFNSVRQMFKVLYKEELEENRKKIYNK